MSAMKDFAPERRQSLDSNPNFAQWLIIRLFRVTLFAMATIVLLIVAGGFK